MSNDFDLDKSRWYNLMKLGMSARNSKVDAASIIERARNLGKFEYEPTAGQLLADAENNLTEALFAVKVAREEYEKHTQLVAAE